jgi:purine-binding chemotaxis protein CheW
MNHALPTSLAGDKYLAVRLENEAYGIPVMTVREIIRLQRPAPVSNVPAYIKGRVEIRGRVVPLVDLRVRLGFKAEFSSRTCIVVVQVTLPAGRFLSLGLVVDGVEEVVAVPFEEIDTGSDEVADPEVGCLHRTVPPRRGLKAVLDVDHIADATLLETLAQST